MNIINVSVAELIEQQQPEYCVVPIGNQGEHGVTRILFDCTQFISLYGEGIAQLLHQRNGDGIPYIATVSQEENVITWDISGDDTARDGFGKLQLNWYVSGNLAKSCVLRTMVKKALTDATLIPEEVKSDLELLTETVANKNPLLVAGANITLADNQDGTQTISASGGGGSTYSAGDGIDITDDTISVDYSSGDFELNTDNELTIKLGTVSKEQSSWLSTTGFVNASNLASWFKRFDDGDFFYDNDIWTLKTSVLSGKQDTLTAGAGISIASNVISATLGVTFSVVQTLPASGVEQTIYLVPKQGSTSDVYDEFIWVNSAYEKIGSTEVDLSNYYTKSQTDTLLAGKQASGDYATNTALSTGLAGKADASTTYTKTEVDGLISAAIADVSSLIGGASS